MSEPTPSTNSEDVTVRLPPPTRSPSSRPSGSSFVADLPLPEDLQKMLPEGQYIIESFLGQGGMAAVYKGFQMPLRRPVAIKILQKGVGDEFDSEDRFRREAYAMAALTHPHIVQVYDSGEAGGNFLFISMELLEGGDLRALMKRGDMSPQLALELLPQICDALQFAHENGIVHRDIKPANIMLAGDGRVKVADFGLAKIFDAQSSFMTQSGLGMGTPDYAAPEQYDGAKDLDHRADIYALGVMMYQMLTGILPRGAWRAPSHHSGVDTALDDIVLKAMEPMREFRYQSATDLKTDILRITSAMPDPPADAVPPDEPPPTVALQPQPQPSTVSRKVPEKKGGTAGIYWTVGTLGAVAATFGILSLLEGDAKPVAPASAEAEPAPAATPAVVDSTVPTGRPATGTTNSTSPVRQPAAGEATSFGGHSYLLMQNALTWDDAKAKAESMGGYLAVISTDEEVAWFLSTYGPALSPTGSMWVGASCEKSTLPWRWLKGETLPVGIAGWLPDEPRWTKDLNARYVLEFARLDQKTGWRAAVRGTLKKYYFVEWDGAAPPPSARK